MPSDGCCARLRHSGSRLRERGVMAAPPPPPLPTKGQRIRAQQREQWSEAGCAPCVADVLAAVQAGVTLSPRYVSLSVVLSL